MSPTDALKSPRPHPLLNKQLLGNASSLSVNEMPHTPSGLRAQLGHLLPRHANFRARVTIHQIASVPLVSGEFGVRWKFKGVQNAQGPKQGLLRRAKARRADKGKGREEHGDGERFLDALSPGSSASGGPSPHTANSSISSHSQHLSADWTTTTTSTTSATTPNSSVITMGLTLSTHSGTTTPDLSTVLLPGSTTPARGMTAFLPLKEHSVVWSQTLDTVLKFDIDRETFQIMASPLKLVVMQRVIPDDPRGSPQNPRLGAVYLNLAEYVGHGPVERRYLLKESKTNATLKLTIEMDYVSGETHYVPPPLAKGEILNGIAGFLENDIVKKRPRALDIYQEHDEPLKSARVPKTAKSERKVSPSTTTSPDTDSDDEYFEYSEEEDELPEIAESVEVAFDVRKLPVAQGIKTTETLIEALFNPVTTNEKSQETPFTIYEPFSAGPTPTAYGLGLTGIPIDRHATITVGRGYPQRGTHTSRYSTSSSSASVRTTTSDSSKSLPSRENSFSQSEHSSYSGPYHGMRATPEGRVVVENKGQDESTSSLGGMRGWWKRAIGSRPGTPTAARA